MVQAIPCGTDRNSEAMPFSSATESQRTRILHHLRTEGPLTTMAARLQLDILHPAARVQELRKRGYCIVTHRQTVDTGKGRHSVAKYVLLSEGV